MCDVQTKFYMTSYVRNEEPFFLELCGRGIQLLCCGKTYTIDTSDPDHVQNIKTVAFTITDVVMGIFALVTIIPTIIALVGKVISHNERISTIFNQVLNPVGDRDDAPVLPIRHIIGESIRVITTETTPVVNLDETSHTSTVTTPVVTTRTTSTTSEGAIVVGRPDGTCDFKKTHINLSNLSEKPNCDGTNLDTLKARSAHLDFYDINHVATTLITNPATLFQIAGVLDSVPTLYGLNTTTADNHELKALLRVILQHLNDPAVPVDEKREILSKIAGLAKTCIFTYFRTFHEIVDRIIFKNGGVKAQIMLWIHNFKKELFDDHFTSRSIYDSIIGRTRNLQWHATSAVQDACGHLIGLFASKDNRNNVENKHITSSDIHTVILELFNPQELIIYVRDRLNSDAMYRPADKFGPFLIEALKRKIPDSLDQPGDDPDGLIENYKRISYIEAHVPQKGHASLSDEDVKEILVHIGVLDDRPADAGVLNRLKTDITNAWDQFKRDHSYIAPSALGVTV